MHRTLSMLMGYVGVMLAGVLVVRPAAAAPRHPVIRAPRHIVVVIDENKGYHQIVGNLGDAPYINKVLIRQGGLSFSGSHAVAHPSQPNYLDLFSGSNQGITGDWYPPASMFKEPFDTPNLAAQLIHKGYTFREYNQDYSAIADTRHYDSAAYFRYRDRRGLNVVQRNDIYVRKHNAVVNWVNPHISRVRGNELPPSIMTGFRKFPVAPAGWAKLPTVSLVIPNLEYDMHNGSIQAGDAWLAKNINGYLQWAKTHESMLLIIWDEDDGTRRNQIPTIINGDPSLFRPGNSHQVFNAYSVLRTIEDMYGLGYAGNAAHVPDLAVNAAGKLVPLPKR